MSIDCYATLKNCIACARNRVTLCRHRTPINAFLLSHSCSMWPSTFLASSSLLPAKNKFLLVVSDRLSKLVRTVPLLTVNAEAVFKTLVTHRVNAYGPPRRLLSGIRKQFTSKFFSHVRKMLATENVFTKMCQPQSNGQSERYNRKITTGL